MNFKLAKTFLFLKSRPNIFSPLEIVKNPRPISFSKWNWKLNSLDQFILLDYGITQLIITTKEKIRQFIDSFKVGEFQLLKEKKECLKKNLEEILLTLKRLDFFCIDHRLGEIFEGQDGLYTLYRYVWTPDLLKLLNEISQFFVDYKFEEKITFFKIKYEKYRKIIEQIMQREASNILKQIKKGMYLIPQDWSQKLIKNKDFPPYIESIFRNKKAREELIANHGKQQSQEESLFQISFTALFYFNLEENFFDYLTYLKSVILNKVTGIMNGDYEIWERIYDVCLKLYSKKQNVRRDNLIQIDQLLQQPYVDNEFYQFLQKVDCSEICLSSINFYIKNSTKNVRQQLSPIAMKKIMILLNENPWKYSEDVFEFLETQASEESVIKVIDKHVQIIQEALLNEIEDEKMFDWYSGLTELINHCSRFEHLMKKLVNESFFKKLIECIKKSDLKNNHQVVYFFINQVLMAGYDDSEVIEKLLKENEENSKLAFEIIKILHLKGFLVHEDSICVLENWLIEKIQNNEDKWFCVEGLVKLLLIGGEECDCKFQNLYPEKTQVLGDWLLNYLKYLSDMEFAERKEIEKFLHEKETYSHNYMKSYMTAKGYKDRLIAENIINFTVKFKESLPFSEMITFAVEYMSFLTFPEVQECIFMNDETYTIYDTITNEFPIESMKLVYKKMNDFSAIQFPENVTERVAGSFWKNNFSPQFTKVICEEKNFGIIEINQLEQIKSAEFYIGLMTNVFNKLNEVSQKSIKELKTIYKIYSKTCLKLWSQVYPLILRNQVENVKKQKNYINGLQLKDDQKCEKKLKQLAKGRKIPFIEEQIVEKNKILTSIREFIQIGKIINQSLYTQNMKQILNPLVQFALPENKGNLLTGIIKMFQLIEYTCPEEMGMEKQITKESYTQQEKWLNKTLQITNEFHKVLTEEKKKKDLVEKNLLQNLKIEIMKIFVPFMLKDIFSNPDLKQEEFNEIIKKNFKIFEKICQIIESICPGEEEHLIILLEIGEEFMTKMKETEQMAKLSEFLFHSIYTLFSFIFKGIRVRSYHLYRFIKSYSKLTGFSTNFFNSIIAYFLHQFFSEFIPQIKLPQQVLNLCDENINNEETQTSAKFQSFTKFEGSFQISQKVCLISMFFNLFSRLNYGGLIQGIQTIWNDEKYKIFYLEYLSKISPHLGKQINQIDQKLCDIMNLDCFGNINIIFREKRTQQQIEKLISYLKIALQSGIKHKIKESISIPIKILMQQIRSNNFKINLEPLCDLNQPEDIINLIIASYNTDFCSLLESNVHQVNLNYISKNAQNKKVIYDMNFQNLQTRNERKKVKQLIRNIKETQNEVTIKGSVDPQAISISQTLFVKFINFYNQSKNISELRQIEGKLLSSLKTLSIIALNNPELIPYLCSTKIQNSLLGIMYDSLNYNLTIFCEIYTLLMKANWGFCEQNGEKYPSNLFYEIMIKMELQKKLLERVEKQPKYLIQALIFTIKNSADYRFRFYRFNSILNEKYHVKVKKFEEQYGERVLNTIKRVLSENIYKQSDKLRNIFTLIDHLLQKLVDSREFDLLKVSSSSQILNQKALQEIAINKPIFSVQKMMNINKKKEEIKITENQLSSNFKVNKVKKVVSHDPFRSKKINQQILYIDSFKDISNFYEFSEEENTEMLSFLEKMLQYSIKNVDPFEEQLINMYYDEKKKTNEYQTLFGRQNADSIADDECDDFLEDSFIEKNEEESFCSMELVVTSSDKVIKNGRELEEMQETPTKDTLVKLYEESVFNPEQMKSLIGLLPYVSTIELQQFEKNVDEELQILVNKELSQRGQNSLMAKSSPVKFQINENEMFKNMQTVEQTKKSFLIPQINEKIIQELLLSSFSQSKTGQNKLLNLMMKLFLSSKNGTKIMKVLLEILFSQNQQLLQTLKRKQLCEKSLKNFIIHTIFNEMVKKKIGLPFLLKCGWNNKTKNIELLNGHNTELEAILQIIMKQNCILQIEKQTDNFICNLMEYFEKAGEYKGEESRYPYYQIHQQIKLDESLVKRLVDKIYEKKIILSQNPQILNYFNLLIYIDPLIFEHHFSIMIEKIQTDLQKIIQKQSKIFESFTHAYHDRDDQNNFMKEENYWNFRQSKKGQKYDDDLEYIRNVMVDFSVYLVPRFKIMRLYFHVGKELRQGKEKIQILKSKLQNIWDYKLLRQIKEKEVEYEEWKKNELNNIISLEIKPIVDQNCQLLIRLLSEAEIYINDFITFFEPQGSEKVVVYNTCAKLYEIVLATDLLTQEQNSSYHSMSQLKTKNMLSSSKYMGSNRRRSSLNVRLSINPIQPCANNILRRLDSSCSFLSEYLGSESQIRELHARYSDFESKVKILWLNKPNKEDEKSFQCQRQRILESTLSSIDEEFATKNIKIKFEGEIGLDYGGVSREWLTLLVQDIINPNLGLFQLSANKRTFQPSKTSFLVPNHLNYFKKFGMIVGKAMQQNWLLQLNLTKSFLKHLLGSTLYVEDLQDIDPYTAKSLMWMLKNKIQDDDLELTFTFEREILGKKTIVELVPGGSQISVKQINKKQYIKLIANFLMTETIRQQSKAFMKGLEMIIPYSTLKLFSYKEISLYFSGMPSVDITEMKKYAKFENFHTDNNEIQWFWQIMEQFNQEERANFLFFLTGSYRVPYGGFKEYPIGFNKMIDCKDYLPVAHTCFSVLDLSTYSTKEKMERLLKKAVKEGKGFSVS